MTSRSGTPTTPSAKRKRPLVHLSLSPDAIARLKEIAEARGTTQSGAVEQLIRRARAQSMSEKDRKIRPCAACGKRVGTATIVAGGDYPDAPLCLDCGDRRPLEEVIEMIQKRQQLAAR